MTTQIFVEGRELDVNSDISSLITFAIDDVRDFSSRQTAYSKTVVLPGTAKNNAIFGNIFDTGIGNAYDPAQSNVGYNFNAAKSAVCVVFQDNLQTFKGTLRLLTITKDKTRIEYEAALNGDLTILNFALSTAYLTDLDFSEHDLTYNTDNIVASWDNAPGSGVYFPLIDYGTYSTLKHDWDIRTFRPALYVKEYIDKMFAAANFRYNSDLFNSDRFKRLIVPHNTKALTKLSTLLGEATATMTHNVALNNSSPAFLVYDFISATGFTLSDVYEDGFWKLNYTGTDNITINFKVQSSGTFQAPTGSAISTNISLYHVRGATTTLLDSVFFTSPDDQPFPYSVNFTHAGFLVQTGDYFYTKVIEFSAGFDSYTQDSASFTITTDVAGLVNINPGDVITLNDTIPANILQVDYLVSIVKLFNLYVYESPQDERIINITPFIDFYETGSESAVDWTYKLNRDKPITITPMSELNSNIYNFRYADDSDYWNDLYNKRYNQSYGSYIFNSDFEFTTDTNDLVLIFSPTPLIGYVGEDKVYPTILKRSGTDSAPVEETTDSVIRIMQTRKILDVLSWDIKDGATSLVSLTNYGYAGHLDSPDNPSNDLNFGALSQLFFTLIAGDLTKTQFNLYWSGYMAEITDKDSKLVTASFYLRPQDIFNLDFGKYIYMDGVLFRLNKITDYNATIPSDCQVELLKVIQTAYSFPPTSLPGVSESFFLLVNNIEPLIDSDESEIDYI